MPGETEHVDVKLPSGETVTAIVPAGMSDSDIHALMQQKHPEYFRTAPRTNGPAQAGKPGSGWHATAPLQSLTLGLAGGAGIPETQTPVKDLASSFIAPDNAYAQAIAAGHAKDPTQDPAYNWQPTPQESATFQKALEARSWWQKLLGSSPTLPPELQAKYDAYGKAHIMNAYKNYAPGLPIVSGAAEASAHEADRSKQAFQTGSPYSGIVRGAGALVPVVGPAAVETGEEIGEGAQNKDVDQILHGTGKGIGMIGTMALGTKKGQAVASDAYTAAKNAPKTAIEFFRKDLAASSHDILNKTATGAKRQLWNAHQNVSTRVGQLINDISTADYQSGEPSIPVQDLWNKISDIADDYKANGKTTPKFDAAQKQVLASGPMLSWKELHDLKSEIGSQWAKAAEGSRDAGATNALMDAINEKLAARAKELDRTEQYKAYNSLWKTLQDYHDGAMGDLINAKSGQEFFDALRDPANKAELQRTVNSLSKFGLPEDFSTSLIKRNAPLHDYVTSQKSGFSKIRLAVQHPAAAIPGIAVGTAAGSVVGAPWVGSAVGAVGAVKGAARLRAANALADIGRLPLTGEMEQAAKVAPVSDGSKPTPPAPTTAGPSTPNGSGGKSAASPTVNEQEIVSALKNLGYDPKTARTTAREAIAEHPHDFDAALNRAIRGNTPQTTAQQIKNVQTGKPANWVEQAKAENQPNPEDVARFNAATDAATNGTKPATKAAFQSDAEMEDWLNRRVENNPAIQSARDRAAKIRSIKEQPAEPTTDKKSNQVTVNVEGRDRTVTLNDEQMEKWNAEQTRHQKAVEFYQRQAQIHEDQQQLAADLKGEGMKHAANKRQITGQLTGIESAAQRAREASNYQGKQITVKGEPGTVQGMAFGRVRVKLDSGKTVTVDPADVGPGTKAALIKDIQQPTETPKSAPEPPAAKAQAIQQMQERRNPATRIDPTSITAARLTELRNELVKTSDPAERANIQQAIDYEIARHNQEFLRPPEQATAENLPEKQPRDYQPAQYTRGVSQDNKKPAEINRGDVSWVDPKDVKLDPQRFQYKTNVNEKGVTNQYADTKQFNENLAGVVHVFKAPETGKLFAVNGHHRTELAQRTGATRMLVNALNVRDAVEARAMGALQNIAEGRGTAVDAAKFFRDTGTSPDDLQKMGISVSESKVSDGLALSRLEQGIFDRVATGKISEGRGVAIGEATGNPAQQEAIVKLIERAENRGKTVTDATVAELARMVKNAGTVESESGSLFGPVAQVSSLAIEKAEVSAFVKRQILQEKNLFGAVAKESKAQQLGRVQGQSIKTEENARISQQAAQAAEAYDKLSAYTGPINSILEKAARRLADGDNPNRVKQDAYQSVREEISKTLNGAEGAPRP